MFTSFSKKNQTYFLHFQIKGPTRKAVENLVECYRNQFPDHPNSIFIAKKSISVYWGHMSVLEADLICLRELRARNKQWQHAATLAGTGEIFFRCWELLGTIKEC
jgi:hypothetical protein